MAEVGRMLQALRSQTKPSPTIISPLEPRDNLALCPLPPTEQQEQPLSVPEVFQGELNEAGVF